jgi:tetratricopeptide (TPR) repeat protein
LNVETLPANVTGAIEAAFREGRFRYGVAVANKALLLSPLLADVWHLKTAFLTAVGFRRSLEEVLRHLATIDIPSAPGEEEEGLYRSAIDKEPTNAAHYVDYAMLLRNQSRINDALNWIDMGLLVPADPEIKIRLLEDRAYLCCEKDLGTEALKSIKQALALGANGIRAHYLHGRALALVGRLKEAKAEILWVLDADPDNADANRAMRIIDPILGKDINWLDTLAGYAKKLWRPK